MIKSIAKVTAGAAFKWVKIFVPGLLFSIICCIIALFLLANNEGPGTPAAGHTGIMGAIVGFIALFAADFWVMLLLVSSLVFIPLYFALANKLAIQTAISSVLKNSLQAWFSDKLTSYLDGAIKKSGALSSINDYASTKLQLADSIRNDSESSKWQKKMLTFILKKIRLDDVDFSTKDLKIASVISGKVNDLLSGLAEPSNRPFYMAMGIEMLLLVLAFVFDQ